MKRTIQRMSDGTHRFKDAVKFDKEDIKKAQDLTKNYTDNINSLKVSLEKIKNDTIKHDPKNVKASNLLRRFNK